MPICPNLRTDNTFDPIGHVRHPLLLAGQLPPPQTVISQRLRPRKQR